MRPFLCALLLVPCLAARALALAITGLNSKSFDVNQDLVVTWQNDTSLPESTLITIDLVNDQPTVLLGPFPLASAPISELGTRYTWKISSDLISGVGYHVRIYPAGTAPPASGSPAFSQAFSIYNRRPRRQSSLTVIEPSGSVDGRQLESTCLLGEVCSVVWSYPAWAEVGGIPKKLDILLFKPGNPEPLAYLARDVDTTQKAFQWQIPASMEAQGVTAGDHVFVAVLASNSTAKILGAGMSTYRAASGYPFVLESRAVRDARHAAGPQSSIDFTAPGPITSTPWSATSASASVFVDVPRPTYAAAPVQQQGPSAASSAGALPAPQPHVLLALASILFLAWIQ